VKNKSFSKKEKKTVRRFLIIHNSSKKTLIRCTLFKFVVNIYFHEWIDLIRLPMKNCRFNCQKLIFEKNEKFLFTVNNRHHSYNISSLIKITKIYYGVTTVECEDYDMNLIKKEERL